MYDKDRYLLTNIYSRQALEGRAVADRGMIMVQSDDPKQAAQQGSSQDDDGTSLLNAVRNVPSDGSDKQRFLSSSDDETNKQQEGIQRGVWRPSNMPGRQSPHYVGESELDQ